MVSFMKKHLKIVCAIWYCYFTLALLLIGYFVGFFADGTPLECYISYLFGFGYFINHCISPKWIAGMPVSDWRWILGVLVMLASSLPPIFVRKIVIRIVGYTMFVIVQVLGLSCLLYDMICAIT